MIEGSQLIKDRKRPYHDLKDDTKHNYVQFDPSHGQDKYIEVQNNNHLQINVHGFDVLQKL